MLKHLSRVTDIASTSSRLKGTFAEVLSWVVGLEADAAAAACDADACAGRHGVGNQN